MYEIFEKLLEERNLTVAEVSRATGISQSTFSNWKSRRNKLSANNAIRLASFFGVTVGYLMGEESEDHLSGRYISSRSEKPYYINTESLEMAQRILEDEELHALFKATMTIPKEDLALVEALVKRLRKTNTDE
jgi:transcriptional regulator with XRE-family HTH domain